MAALKFLEGEKIYFRPYSDEDLFLVYSGKNNAQVIDALFLYTPLTMEQTASELSGWAANKETVLFTICRQEDNVPVGQTAFVRIDHISRAAIFYIAIYDPQYWSQGYGGEATKMMVKYGFDTLNLNRIQLHVCSENEKGVAAYKKAGFAIEGTLRQAMYHHNKYIDFYVMGILREEYYNKE